VTKLLTKSVRLDIFLVIDTSIYQREHIYK
jgi:hypothetical protein